jgi:hypothetical protein
MKRKEFLMITHKKRGRGGRGRSLEVAAVEALKVTEEEDVVKVLLGEERAPVPSRGETAINARATIVTRSIKAVSEEVTKDRVSQNIRTSILFIHKMTEERIRLDLLSDAMDGPDDGRKNARDLGVFVDKDKSIRDITVAKMNNTETNPLPTHSALDHGKDSGHGTRDTRGGLDTVEALAGIGQMVPVGAVQ